jgi:hypothetical protein
MKTDKIGPVRFCWFTENQSDEFIFFNLRNFEKKNPKKLVFISRFLVKTKFEILCPKKFMQV